MGSRITIIVAMVLLWMMAAGAPARPDAVRKIHTLAFESIEEMSGIAKSRRFEDVYWIHNDSGDSARLFAVDSRGMLIIPAFLRSAWHGEQAQAGKQPWPGLTVEVAANIDWEDIAVDDEMIYVADMGNNGNARRDLGVYVIPEPNPRATGSTRALKFVPVRYPGQGQFPARQWHYDSEALFIDEGRLYFLTKHRRPGKISAWEPGTNLYRLDTMKTDTFNVLTQVDAHREVSLATGADLSPDGRHLAVLTYTQLWVFEKPGEGDAWLSGVHKTLPLPFERTKQVEAITWADNGTLIFGNEDAELFRIDLADMVD